MNDEWDLYAVVRSCTATSAAAALNATTVEDYDDGYYNLESVVSGNESSPFAFPTLGNVSGGLEDVYKAGCGQPVSTAGETAIVDGIVGEGFCHQQLPMLTDSHSFSIHTMTSQSPRPRKRKSQEKKIFHLTQEQLNNDLWAWRKYGQKPIKGSPFPRNYYRCSTTKACGAKKQVERSLVDSTIFIVSYSGEHIHPRPTHRSSLAGTTRSNKFNTDIIKSSLSSSTVIDHPPCSSSSPASTSSLSPTTSFREDEYEINYEDDDDGVHIQNIVMDDDVLKNFQNLNGGCSGSG